MKHFFYLVIFVLCLNGVGLPLQAQKLPVGTKGFEKVARSVFTKEGGQNVHFPRFYKDISTSLKGQTLNRAELKNLTRVYIHAQVHAQKAHELAKQEKELLSIPMPSNVPFIMEENVKQVSEVIWKRDRLGTPEELAKLQKTMYKYLSKYPNKQLTLKEFYYVASKFLFEGEKAVQVFFETLKPRPFLTHIQVSAKGKKPLEIFVLQEEVTKALELYYTGKPFTVKDGKVIAQ